MDAISGRNSGVISKLLTWSRDVLLALGVVRIPLVISVAAAVFFGFVPQIIEIYNIMVQHVVYGVVTPKGTPLVVLLSTLQLVLLSMLPFVLMSFVIWYVTQRLVDLSRSNITRPWDAQGPYDVVLEWAPGILATLPIFAAAYGMYGAPKIGVNPEILSAYFSSAMGQVILPGTAGIKPLLPGFATLLATDGVLHSAMHVVVATALLLLLAFGALRPGRVHSPFKPHWAVQTLIWVCAAVVAVLYILVPVLETPAKYLRSSDFQEIWQWISPQIDDPGFMWLLAQGQTWVGTVFTFVLEYWVWLTSILFALVVGGLSYLLWRSARNRSVLTTAEPSQDQSGFFPGWARYLAFLFVAGTALEMTWWTVELSTLFGTIAVITLFFCCLTLVLGQLHYWSEYKLGVSLLAMLLATALVFSGFDWNDNHYVRTLGQSKDRKAREQSPRAIVPESPGNGEFQKWYDSRADLTKYPYPGPYPVYIVAAEGGGIYAANHVASFLAHVQELCPAFPQHLFAISGVSGGSVGATVYAAYAEKTAKNEADPKCPFEARARDPNSKELGPDAIDRTLGTDLLSPLAAAFFFPDLLQRFLPFPVAAFDRARALEFALEAAWRKELGAASPGSDKCDHLLCKSFLEHWKPEGATPALLINTTEVGSGRRRVIAPFRFEGGEDMRFFPLWRDAFDFRMMQKEDELTKQPVKDDPTKQPDELDIPLSTAAMLSARFSFATPAGWYNDYTRKPEGDVVSQKKGDVVKQKKRLVDGGYFENSGTRTALDLINDIKRSNLFVDKRVEIKLIVLTSTVFVEQTSFGFGEIASPIVALDSTRGARTPITIASARLELRDVTVEVTPERKMRAHMLQTVHLRDIGYKLPLGWRLTALTQNLIKLQNGDRANCELQGKGSLDYLEQATKISKSEVKSPQYEADCVLKIIGYELNPAKQSPEAEKAAVIGR